MQIISGVFTVTKLQKVRECETETDFVVENLVMKRESKAWCCGHLRQRIKVLHPVMFSYTEACPFHRLLLEGTPEDASDVFSCMCGCPGSCARQDII